MLSGIRHMSQFDGTPGIVLDSYQTEPPFVSRTMAQHDVVQPMIVFSSHQFQEV
jgi:hypothetical protein